MQIPQDHDEALLAAGGASAVLVRRKDRIITRFRDTLRERLEAARREPAPILINTLPAFITRLALALAPDNEIEFASEYSNLALAHGNERAKLTDYSLAELIHEYQILREILRTEFREDPAFDWPQWGVVHRSIDEAMAEAAAAYVQVHQHFRELFTAALSHDFRGPLSNATNYLELIRRDAEPGQHGHFAARALQNLKRIDRMIGELLDVSRANAGVRLALRIERCEAAALAGEVIGELTLRAGDRFHLEAKETVHGWWDCDRIKQALYNLLENAVKYGQEGAPIICRLGTTDGRLFLSVHNHGEPIPPEMIPVLFQPFRRSLAAENSQKGGWGLGLVMVQTIAEAHGGSVSVESSEAEGTTFTIDILCDARQKLPPNAEEDRDDKPKPAARLEPSSAESNQ
jgi:signal transduction histidine kinase